MNLFSWATRPISEEEGRWRTVRGFRAGILGLWAGVAVAAGGMAHRWVARDYDWFVLCWFMIFGLGITIVLLSFGALAVARKGQRWFFGASGVMSGALLVATTTATFQVPHGVAEQFEGVLIRTHTVRVP